MMNKHHINKQIEMEHFFQHNVFVKKMIFKEKGMVYCGHHHEYDHVTLVAAGKISVKFSSVPEGDLPEEIKEYAGTSMFVTRSYREHEITALEDNTVVCCVHAVREEGGEIIGTPSHVDKNKVKTQRGLAFDMTPEERLKCILRAEEEGTLKPGNADILI